MAVFMYLFLLLAFFDTIRLILFLLKIKIHNIHTYSTGVIVLLCAILIVYGVFHARSIKTANYSITLPGGGSDIRIVLASDLHIGPKVGEKWIRNIVDAINKAQPDIVCLAGDIFDGYLDATKDMPEIISQLKRINAAVGVYACLGNHDIDNISFTNSSTTQIEEILRQAGIVLLKDEIHILRENLYLAGRKDARPIGMSADRKSPKELLDGFNGTIIVMDHQPTQFPLLENAGAHLVLSGHTHTGQLFPGRLITKKMFQKLGATHYGHWQGQTMQGVVTSGAAVWGPPLRVGTNSEIAVIDISFKE